jgi:hypothetical protein
MRGSMKSVARPLCLFLPPCQRVLSNGTIETYGVMLDVDSKSLSLVLCIEGVIFRVMMRDELVPNDETCKGQDAQREDTDDDCADDDPYCSYALLYLREAQVQVLGLIGLRRAESLGG